MKSGKRPVLVTGAGRGIGACLCQSLLADGQPVIAHYRRETDAIFALQAAGADIMQADFANAAAIQAFADAVRQNHSSLGAIVHNASAFGPTAANADQASAQFQTFFNVHMLAPFLLNHALAELLGNPEAPGDIVHITDIYADNPAPVYNTYCATKAGAQNLALSFAKTLAPAVKVNIIQPGPISFADWHGEDAKQHVLADTPMGRTGSADNIYRALRSILDNDYMTGAIIAVDGGRRLGTS